MNKGAEMSQSRPLAQLQARRFAQTAQSALFIACLIVCLIAVFPLALPLAGENARTGPYPSGSLSAPYQLYRPALFQIRGPGGGISA